VKGQAERKLGVEGRLGTFLGAADCPLPARWFFPLRSSWMKNVGWGRRPMRTDSKHQAALALIKTAMIEKKMTQAELADAADCHEKTIQNLLSGRSVRDQTLFDVCMVLGLDFDKVKDAWDGHAELRDAPEAGVAPGKIAPVYMGAYSRDAVDHYLGSYLTLRPSFSTPGGVMAYRTDIIWDDEWPSLVFQERDRPDTPFLHRGRLYIPASSMFVHFVSLTKGAMRMVIVSQLDIGGQMRGLITTLNKQRAQFIPVSAPIVYAKRSHFDAVKLGEIGAGDATYAVYRQLLDETLEQGYVRLIQP
jgi:transcriptional regulator with XRE-family HTH domain